MESSYLDAGRPPLSPDFESSPQLDLARELPDEYPSLLSPSLSVYPELSIFEDDISYQEEEGHLDGEIQVEYEDSDDHDDPVGHFDPDDDTLHDARHLLETIKEEPEENDTGDETLCLPEQHSEEEDDGSFTQLVDHADEVEVGQSSVLPRDSSPPPQSPAGSFMSLSGSVSSISRVRIRSRPASLRFHTAATLTLREQELLLEARDKEIFSLKLENHFLQERLAQKNPEAVEAVVKSSIAVKIANQSLSMEVKKYRKQLKALERDLQEHQEESERNENALLERLRGQEFLVEEEKRRREKVGSGRLHSNTSNQRSLDPTALAERQAMLEEELGAARDALQETNDELERLHRALEKSNASPMAQRNARFADMETDSLRSKHEAQLLEIRSELEQAHCDIETRDQKIEELEDALASLRLENERLEHDVRHAVVENSQSRVEMSEERHSLQMEKDALRDQVASLSIQLEQKENDLEARVEELDIYAAEIERQDEELETLKQELEDERARGDELHEDNLEREAKIEVLTRQVNDASASLVSRAEEVQSLRTQHAQALSSAENELERSKAEVGKVNSKVIELGQTLERNAIRSERELTEVLSRLQSREELCDQLRDKITSTNAEFAKLRDLYFNAQDLIADHQAREDELIASMEELARSRDQQRFSRSAAELALKEVGEQLFDAEDDLKRERTEFSQIKSGLTRELSDKSQALLQAQSAVKSLNLLLEQREADLSLVRSALKELEQQQKTQLGKGRTSDSRSFDLDLDRLQWELQLREDELQQAREVIQNHTRVMQEQHTHIDQLSFENEEMSTHVSSLSQSRDSLLEQLKRAEETLRHSEDHLDQCQARVAELVQKQSADKQSHLSKEQQYRDQLTERNTLLLASSHCVEKILGADGSEITATTDLDSLEDFSSFKKNLTCRLTRLEQIRAAFEATAKEIEDRYSEKVSAVMRALDERSIQIEELARLKGHRREKHETRDLELKSSRVAISQLATKVTNLERQVNDQLKELDRTRDTRREINPPAESCEETKEISDPEKDPSASRSTTPASQPSASPKGNKQDWVSVSPDTSECHTMELETNIKELHQQIEITNKRAAHLGAMLKTARRVLFMS